MFSDTFLFQQNEILIVAIVLALLLIATEIGFRPGRSAAPKHESMSKSQHSTLQSATMGLLALLLAFTFSMSAARFEIRKQLIVEEANAIGTAVLRARLLPEANQGAVTNLFRSYLDVRLEVYRAGSSDAELDETTRPTTCKTSSGQRQWMPPPGIRGPSQSACSCPRSTT